MSFGAWTQQTCLFCRQKPHIKFGQLLLWTVAERTIRQTNSSNRLNALIIYFLKPVINSENIKKNGDDNFKRHFITSHKRAQF
jgi:hypothetical protein